MKESEEDRLKYVVYESTLSTAARSPFPNGEGLRYEDAVFPILSFRAKADRYRRTDLYNKGGVRNDYYEFFPHYARYLIASLHR